jgi:uncharacterized lipoprotein YddW (UPF0748 family)
MKSGIFKPRQHQQRIIELSVLLILLVNSPSVLGQREVNRVSSVVRSRSTGRVSVPPLLREFRGVWVATVANIDWPSRKTLTTDEQKAELIRLLDKAQELRLNAIIFQIRPQCDALYASSLEPWSEFLTGQQGQAPSPLYDPLEFAITEAHARGMELHAWLNPYRASHPSASSSPAASHISVTRPDLVRQYGRYKWLDPGESGVQEHSFNVVLDVVRRYQVDGIHFDDYFYPYLERDANNQVIAFPDEAVYQRYQNGGGTLSKADWRRKNVNDFIQRVSQGIKSEKPYVKFGISPFGIWQPGNPPGISGMNAYTDIYADSRKWLMEGWVDYFTPQLYWPINQAAQSYTALLDWWIAQNPLGRHLWPGNAAYRIDNATTFPATELVSQIEMTRARAGSSGNVHFSLVHFLNNRGGITELLKAGAYAQPALVPMSPWMGGTRPDEPLVSQRYKGDEVQLKLRAGETAPGFWVVSWEDRATGQWQQEIIAGKQKQYMLSRESVSKVAITAIDHYGQESKQRILTIRKRQ